MLHVLSEFEKEQRKWTLTIVNWVILAASLLLTLFNIQFDSFYSILSLTLLDFLCILAIILNFRGFYTTSAVVISLAVLVTITISIYDGDGLFDPGMAAYPIYIIFGTLLLGKRSVLAFTLSALGSLLLIGFLQSRGLIHATLHPNDFSNMIPYSVFNLVAGLVTWVIMSNIDKDLARIQRDESDLREAYEKTLIGWAKALEYRDKETEGHSQRVVALSERFARALSCDEEEIQNIKWGAILHDIGKMGIPDQILLKAGSLDVNETEIMHRHPQYGADMLSGIKFLEPALKIVYSHHERWNGCGYPQGLKGEDIPFSARLFAIVDNWDALNSDRPYRTAWRSEMVVAYIKENAGILFDPDMVDVFLQMDKS